MNQIITSQTALGLRGYAAKLGKQDLRRQNMHLLLHIIQTDGPTSQAELGRRSGLSPATVSGILQPLIEAQFLIEEGKTTAGLGRRASILAFNSNKAVTVGVSIDHEECDVALVDFSGRTIDRESVSYARYADPNEVVTLAAECLSRLLERKRMVKSSIVGVGVAAPGLINSRSGLVQVALNLGWNNVQLRALFEQRFGLPARLEHLGRAKARAEAMWGKGKGHRNFVCLEIGTGIGAGVMTGGRILRGAGGIAGEVGHTPIDPSGPACTCGLKGCWEVYCSAPAIRRRLLKRLEAGSASQSTLTPTSTLAELDTAYQSGDALAREVVEESAQYLVRGLVVIIWSFDPEFLLLTGSVVRDCPCLIDVARKVMNDLRGARKFDVPLIVHAEQAGTGVVAASAAVSSRYLEELATNGVLPTT